MSPTPDIDPAIADRDSRRQLVGQVYGLRPAELELLGDGSLDEMAAIADRIDQFEPPRVTAEQLGLARPPAHGGLRYPPSSASTPPPVSYAPASNRPPVSYAPASNRPNGT